MVQRSRTHWTATCWCRGVVEFDSFQQTPAAKVPTFPDPWARMHPQCWEQGITAPIPGLRKTRGLRERAARLSARSWARTAAPRAGAVSAFSAVL
eukprot:gene11739-biopygen1760